MTKAAEFFFKIIQSKVCGAPMPDANVADAPVLDVCNFAARHAMALPVLDFYLTGSERNAALLSPEQKNKFSKSFDLGLYKSVLFDGDAEIIKNVFNSEKIDFIPLKGAVIKGFYPERWMRSSVDMDILVKKEDIKRALKALETAGYSVLKEKGHHAILKSPSGWILELHHGLTDADTPGKAILDSAWEFAMPVSENEYRFTEAFFYFYHVFHMAHHIGNGGCGIRPFLDLWLINRQFGNIEKELVLESGLSEFAEKAEIISEKWFSEKPYDQSEPSSCLDVFEKFIIEGGSQGTDENAILINRNLRKNRLMYFSHRIFLPAEELKKNYPGAKAHPALIPAYQVRRWIAGLRRDRKRFRKELKYANGLSPEKIKEIGEMIDSLNIRDFL